MTDTSAISCTRCGSVRVRIVEHREFVFPIVSRRDNTVFSIDREGSEEVDPRYEYACQECEERWAVPNDQTIDILAAQDIEDNEWQWWAEEQEDSNASTGNSESHALEPYSEADPPDEGEIVRWTRTGDVYVVLTVYQDAGGFISCEIQDEFGSTWSAVNPEDLEPVEATELDDEQTELDEEYNRHVAEDRAPLAATDDDDQSF